MREPGDAGPPIPQPLPGAVQRPLRQGADRRLSGERGKAVGNAAARQPGRAGKAFGRRVGGGQPESRQHGAAPHIEKDAARQAGRPQTFDIGSGKDILRSGRPAG